MNLPEREIGSSGVEITRVGFGAWALGACVVAMLTDKTLDEILRTVPIATVAAASANSRRACSIGCPSSASKSSGLVPNRLYHSLHEIAQE
jgi:hypothetical protein